MTYDIWHYLTRSLNPLTFGGCKFCGGGDKSFRICHMISRDYARAESYDLISENPSPLVTSLPKLLVIRLVEEMIRHNIKSQMTLWLGVPHPKSLLSRV